MLLEKAGDAPGKASSQSHNYCLHLGYHPFAMGVPHPEGALNQGPTTRDHSRLNVNRVQSMAVIARLYLKTACLYNGDHRLSEP